MSPENPSRRELLRFGALATAASFAGIGWTAAAADYDVAILNGRVIDPETGLDGVRHVGIKQGRIAAISKKELKGAKTIDARGLVVAPGFIDPISHGQDLENDLVQVFDGVTTKLQLESGVADQREWYAAQAGNRIANYGAGCGHGYVRSKVLGDNSNEREATDAEVAQMAQLLDAQLTQGALGVGFGLEYRPGTTRWEVIEMFRIAGRHGASCHVHTRYGTMLEEQSNLTAIEEVLSAAIVAGAPLHIVHVPSMALRNTDKALEFILRAQKRGLDVTADFYPYPAFGTGIGSEVFAPGWKERFGIDFGDLEWAATHERLTAATFARYRQQGGMVIAHAIPEAAVRAAVKSPATMVGSDGGLSKGVGHPRSAGTFARVLGHYVREEKLLTLPAAIEKMTLKPARRLEKRSPQFKKKGRLQVGCDADIVVFDPKTVIDRATFNEPALTSAGFHWVLIGANAVIADGKLNESARPGRPLTGARI